MKLSELSEKQFVIHQLVSLAKSEHRKFDAQLFLPWGTAYHRARARRSAYMIAARIVKRSIKEEGK